ncbi:MAG: preprotein translocase subunit SecY [Candidatus Poribacteria bacterium]|nr:preprotein translocase subunit SecY [Candidatus Poribacteria bacterium]MDP6961225.1 preprotein translocase subunit SecY [Dehalococcoidia bacterium]
MIQAFRNALKIPELRQRLFFTALLLFVYRIGAHITLPGIDDAALANWFNQQLEANEAGKNIVGFINLFSGGAFKQMSIFALGIQPYISASIAMQLLAVVIPSLEKLSKEDGGRKKITQYTRYGTVILSVVQGVAITTMLKSWGEGDSIVTNASIGWTLLVVITLMAGTAFVMWLGEQITERGIGQGISIIITAGIVAAAPGGVQRLFADLMAGRVGLPQVAVLILLTVVAIMGTVFITLSVRRIPVQYAKRVVGRKVFGGQTTHIPLRVNIAGMIPIIFAVTLMQFPGIVFGFLRRLMPDSSWINGVQVWFGPTRPLYYIVYSSLIIGFTYFYTAVQINPVDMADNLRKHGGFIPGVRPGKRTAEYINNILTRITLPGAVFLAAIAVIPMIFQQWLKIGTMVQGASLLIVVGVALDTMNQIESYLTTRHYDGFLREGRMRSRRG